MKKETLTYKFSASFTPSEKVKLFELERLTNIKKNVLVRKGVVALYEREIKNRARSENKAR